MKLFCKQRRWDLVTSRPRLAEEEEGQEWLHTLTSSSLERGRLEVGRLMACHMRFAGDKEAQ